MYTWIESLLICLRNGFRQAGRRRVVVEEALLERGDLSETHVYNFSAPYGHGDDTQVVALAEAITNTRAFRRLRHIRFLGALDYYLVTNPNGQPQNSRFSRAQHSLGVASLAQTYLQLKDHDLNSRLVCVSAALLHDIGHTPFSHTLEPVFQEMFGLDHHAVSEAIIRGESPEFEDVLGALRDHGVDPDEVVEVLSGNDERFDFNFSGPINFDTIEGILRSRRYIKMLSFGLTPQKVVRSSLLRRDDRDQRVVDNFWLAKNEMYNLVIRSAFGAMFDMVFQEILRSYRQSLSPNDFYLTDAQAFRRFPRLRRALELPGFNRLRRDLIGNEAEVAVRTFYVEQSVSFFMRRDKERYLQSKVKKKWTLPSLAAS